MLSRCILFIALLILAACSRHEVSEFDIEGLQKDEVLDILGRPARKFQLSSYQLKTSMIKPELATSLEDGETVEVWHFRVTDSRRADVFFGDDGYVVEVMIYRTDVTY